VPEEVVEALKPTAEALRKQELELTAAPLLRSYTSLGK
jgi:hypothetical protein